MYANKLFAVFLGSAEKLYHELSRKDRSKIAGAVEYMRVGDFESVEIKTLDGPIKELKICQYRFLFYIERTTIYFLRGFVKKSNKTPKNEIKMAWRLYSMIINTIELS